MVFSQWNFFGLSFAVLGKLNSDDIYYMVKGDHMREMTKANLTNAFAGESQAHMRYLIYADQAEKDGKPKVANLFRAIAHAERVHATNHFKTLGELGDTVANLASGVDGEHFEIYEMYPAYDAVANLQDEKAALRSIHYALEAEKIHEKMYEDAGQVVSGGDDISIEKVYICPVCGHTAAHEAPDKCPGCGAPKEKYREFVAQG